MSHIYILVKKKENCCELYLKFHLFRYQSNVLPWYSKYCCNLVIENQFFIPNLALVRKIVKHYFVVLAVLADRTDEEIFLTVFK